MGRTSTIKKLPQEILDEINKLLEAEVTLDEITKRIRAMGESVSRSALGRYKLSFDDMMEQVKQSRIVAEAMVENLGDATESKVARANIELLHSALLKINLENAGELETKEILALSKATEALAKARKIDQDTLVEASKIMQKKAAEEIDKAAVGMGMTKETRDKFNEIIFGIEV